MKINSTENNQLICINFDELEKLELGLNELYELEVHYNSIKYYMKINIKEHSDKVVIFSNGAIDPKKSTPPIYMRSSWDDDINASTIFLDDPTLLNTDMRLGWGQGSYGDFALESISIILKKILYIYKFRANDTYFYGSSAGGFMSMYLAILIPGTKAIVNNPQTDVLSYVAPYVKRMLRYSYGINEIDDVPKELNYRFNIAEAFKYYKIDPSGIYYLQNYCCEDDMHFHLNPFIKQMNLNNISMSNVLILNYFHNKLGHNPLPKDLTINYINQIIDNKLDFKL